MVRVALATFVLWTAVLPFNASAQAINAASFRVPGAPGYGVARGAIFVLFGQDLGPRDLVEAPSLPLGANLAGTSVRVTVGSAGRDAFIVYTSSGQVAAVLPSDTPEGEGRVVLTYNGRTSNPIAIHVVKTSMGVFTRNSAGHGPGIIQNFIDASTQPATNALNAAAQPGQTAVLWGTGLGPISASDADRPPVGNLDVDVSVLVGGKSVQPTYHGRSPEFPGIDQINFVVPDGVAGCYVPVSVKAAGVVSNYVSMAIAPNGGTCSDPVSVASQDVNAAAGANRSRLGFVTAERVRFIGPLGGVEAISDTGTAVFRSRDLPSLLASRPLLTNLPAPGTCTAVAYRLPSEDREALEPPDRVAADSLNAGALVNINGGATLVQLFRTPAGPYTNTNIPRFLENGGYWATGGRFDAAVGSFQTPLVPVSPMLDWRNIDTVNNQFVPRSSPLRVTWEGGSDTSDVVMVRGSSLDSANNVRGVFTCTERVTAKSLTVPPDVLSVLPASAAGAGVQPGFIEVGTTTRSATGRFTANGLDGGYFRVTRTDRVTVAFR